MRGALALDVRGRVGRGGLRGVRVVAGVRGHVRRGGARRARARRRRRARVAHGQQQLHREVGLAVYPRHCADALRAHGEARRGEAAAGVGESRNCGGEWTRTRRRGSLVVGELEKWVFGWRGMGCGGDGGDGGGGWWWETCGGWGWANEGLR